MQKYNKNADLKPLPLWLKLVSAAVFLGIIYWVTAVNVGWIQR